MQPTETEILQAMQTARIEAAKRCPNRIDEIAADASTGIMRAIQSFDPAKGSFKTYVSFWIKNEIRRSAAFCTLPVTVSTHVADEPEKRRLYHRVSIDSPDDDYDPFLTQGEEIEESLFYDEPEITHEKIDLELALSILTPKQRQAVTLFYLNGKTAVEVAAILKRDRRNTYHLLSKGLARMRGFLKGEVKKPAEKRYLTPPFPITEELLSKLIPKKARILRFYFLEQKSMEEITRLEKLKSGAIYYHIRTALKELARANSGSQ